MERTHHKTQQTKDIWAEPSAMISVQQMQKMQNSLNNVS